jgi:pimeloyl-ACP methyl ester carboxylesterase
MRGGERMRLAVGGGEVIGERRGRGSPTTVFLHQGVCDRRAWDEVVALMPDWGTKVAYDLRGYGESRGSPDPFSHLGDLVDVLRQLGDGPAWLVGGSLGGGIALDCGLTEPELCAGLILISPAVSGAPEPMMDETTGRLSGLIDRAVAAGNLDEQSRLETWLWLDGPGQVEGRVGGAARALAQSMNLELLRLGQAEAAGQANRPATWGRLEEVAVPTVVAWGDLDLPFLVARSREVSERIAGAEQRELPGLAHLPNLERPELVARLVEDRLQAG